ncbi:hypothetical protein K491DRAFT_610725 [Lophiostoma macrostomum CBS 122681]|uniref:Geranylgeranyl pyrophosphate synthetase n=1 Tax=Lophiostoma macrostomum CBS 122681 TaxID=1314788 RepID=A0A6A6SR58_9PLEO|nr:hypothetical protein K491DRAFT_610725 [Lophiostoma macrostomum CBS 122681]
MSFNSGFRRGGRGGFARARPFSSAKQSMKPDTQKHPLGPLLHTFLQKDIGNFSPDDLSATNIANCELVASYNWLDEKSPTILVPGKPPRWTPLASPQRLPQDSGPYFRDPNAARFPSYPMEPVIQSTFAEDPDFAASDVDIFACGSTLGNLLRFVRGIEKPFRFNVEVIGSTVFLVRKEDDPRETIPDVRGFGHTFPEAYTTWEEDVKKSETHQRVVQYDLGGYRFLIRFECDGYLGPSVGSRSTANRASVPLTVDDDFLQAFDANSLGMVPAGPADRLNVRRGGFKVDQQSAFDLKTRSGKWGRDIDMQDIYPLLWLKQIPNFIIAYHDGNGLFQDIRVQDVKDDVRVWEADNQDSIRRLVGLLEKIVDIAKKDKSCLLDIYSPSIDRLEIRKQYGEGSHALPQLLRWKWEGATDDTVDSIDDGEKSETNKTHSDVTATKSGGGVYLAYDSDDEKDMNYTACSDVCGYCGRCMY